MPPALPLGLIGWLCLSCAAAGELRLDILRHGTFNLFDTDEVVRFDVKTEGTLPDQAEAGVSLKTREGREVARRTVYDIEGDFEVTVGTPGPGFYTLEVSVTQGGYDPSTQSLRSIDDMDNLDEEATERHTAGVPLGVIEGMNTSAHESWLKRWRDLQSTWRGGLLGAVMRTTLRWIPVIPPGKK
ncbi:MAG: hypothetical protein WD708_05800 [Kiritimatiellia bacterium]